ncbi:MAG: GNAT family N-acetyltransferase [Clostridia bacterium]|nr:GNAT family N-acetyltransferase [Clostridia bacterium]
MREYRTKRLVLKVVDSTYADKVLDYQLRNKRFLKRWEPRKANNYYDIYHQKKILVKELQAITRGDMLRLWVLKKDDMDRIIGSVSFTSIERHAFLSCYLGYRLDQNETNKGYMTEAVRKGISIMFNQYKLHRIEADIMPNNVSSLRVAQRLNFINEGISYKFLKINGRWEDHIRMVKFNHRV